MKAPSAIILSLGLLAPLAVAQNTGCRVDQVGYLTGEQKDFRVATSARGFEIICSDGQVALSGTLQGPILDPFAGEDVWLGQFTELRTPGKYTVRLADGTMSWPFAIGDAVYRDALRAAVLGLYASRCGYAVRNLSIAHPPCHVADGKFIMREGQMIPDNRDVSGAWHNGGDYRRSTMSAAQAVSRILWPLELNPAAYDAVPHSMDPDERWGKRPDALAEAKWGLDWLMKMQYADGGVSIGLGPEKNAMPPQIPPQDDTLLNFIGAAYTAHTAKVGAVMAKSARLLRTLDPEYAKRCQQCALACWQFLEANPNVVAPETCKTYGKKEDAMDRLWIAVELFKTTGENKFHDVFKKAFATLESAYPAAPISTQTIRDYNLHEALISYCFGSKADPDIRQRIMGGLKADCDRLVRSADSRGYGNVLEAANWKERHTTGNTLQMAWELAMASELLGEVKYRRVALDQLHFVLGRNPLGKVFVTGLGGNPVRNPHYRAQSIGQQAPPGLLVKGPTLDPLFMEKAILPRFKTPLPPMKSYVDELVTHWCNEPDIEVQGHLIGLLTWADASKGLVTP